MNEYDMAEAAFQNGYKAGQEAKAEAVSEAFGRGYAAGFEKYVQSRDAGANKEPVEDAVVAGHMCCSNCGTEMIDREFRFCPYCGEKFKE